MDPWRRLARAMTFGTAAMRLWRLTLLLLAIGVTWLALSPMPPASMTLGWDKLNHAGAFAALGLSGHLGFPGRRTALWVIAAGLAFGGLIEVLQLFVPGRSSEWTDLLADLVGLACGALVAMGVIKAARSLPALDL